MRVSENTGPQIAGSLQAAYVDVNTSNPLTALFATTEFGGPIEKYNANVNLDYKLGEKGFVYARMAYTHQNRNISRYLVSNANQPSTAAGFLGGSTFENSTILPTSTSSLLTRTLKSRRESENYTLALGGEQRLFQDSGTLSVQGTFSRALSKNPYFSTFAAQVTGIGFQVDRRNRPLYYPAVTQTAGPSWNDPASYRIANISNTITDGAPQDTIGLTTDFTKQFATRFPFKLKLGLNYQNNLVSERRLTDSYTWIGQDGIPNSSDDSIVPLLGNVFRMGKAGAGPFPFLPMVEGRQGVNAPVSYWTKTAAQAYNDLTGGTARKTDYEEGLTAAYVMGTLTIGKVRTVFGVRAERTDFKANSWLRNATAAYGGNSVGGSSIDPAVVAANIARAERSYVGKVNSRSSYSEAFPGVHMIWEPFEGLLVRGSYNKSITRPNVVSILPTGTVDDINQVISIGNPDLKPYLSDNFEVSVEKYFEPVGLFSVGAFQKTISQYFRSFSDVVGQEGIDGSGAYAGYTRTTSRNIGSAEIKGVEFNYQQQFRKLPGLLKGLGASANFTYLKAIGDFGATTITRRLPNMTPRTANVGLSYVGQGWQIRPLLNWTGRTYRGSSGVIDYDSVARTWVDLKIQYSYSRKYSVDLSVFNLTNSAEVEQVSSDGRLPFVLIKPGTAYSVGFTARY
jgi:TonB-dependent receptor